MLTKDYLKKYFIPENYFNRDLSWLEFNRKVLEEAFNPEQPLLEKIKFISIFFSNLDEFYMIRVSGLKEQVAAKVSEPTLDGLTPLQQLRKIEKEVHPMVDSLYRYWNEHILCDLRENNIFIQEIQQTVSGHFREKTRDLRRITPRHVPLPSFDAAQQI